MEIQGGADRIVKVDFDIVDERNSMMAVSLETERKKVDWLDDDEPWGNELVQQHIVRRPVSTESKLNYPAKYAFSPVTSTS